MPQKMTFPTMTPTGLSYTDLMQMRVDAYNAQSGTLTGYDCKTCRNKGMIRNGFSVRYMVWREASNQLKAALTDGSYAAQIAAYKEADVLYIDDLFKTSSTAEVSGADVRLAFEILDYRARNQMLTILSTEWLLPQLRQIDGAIGGRIIQMSKGYAFEIRPDNQKDYRLRK